MRLWLSVLGIGFESRSCVIVYDMIVVLGNSLFVGKKLRLSWVSGMSLLRNSLEYVVFGNSLLHGKLHFWMDVWVAISRRNLAKES